MMTLEKLPSVANTAKIELHGIDLSYYLLFIAEGDSLTPIVDKRGKSIRFNSQYAARTALQEAGVEHFEFVHRSAYNEMAGLDTEGAATEMRLPVTLKRSN